ncbi:glycoside hydrolase family 3 N-terminal domain-containing protein [Alteromonas sp. BMJM2]|uniref:glycoside hydrolase family 3 N-terminal domain-containing protein n=1 Tax=Alteromonas sp. BMJM2 TaxID=2954241 RepID=UPI0022B330A1|nr:glycoside hydrolase family 3 protein [Alteromonas sp. BMJM2]
MSSLASDHSASFATALEAGITTNVSPSSTNVEISDAELKKAKLMIGQKMMLDFRYFCQDDTPSKQCRTPVTVMPQPLLNLLSSENIGGVILFSENIHSAKQLVTMNYELQANMRQAGKEALFIAIDQEGGRVARLPTTILPAFAGNLAIGASAHQHGNAFASNIGEHIGRTLLPLGINTNFAPSVDINSEPNNPVINVRSFGESPEQTAELGEAFVSAMQKAGVLSALKHFPGHGDTRVDSHSGLPRVDHSLKQAQSGDLLPFANIINSDTPPAMVMSAHIQYPSLDNTTIKNKQGELQIVPATLSKRILTGMLRNRLGFDGLIVTDALDMAGISQFFTEEEAVMMAFDAGADIALMPYTIRNLQNIEAFKVMLNSLAMRTVKDKQKMERLTASHQRVLRMKLHHQLGRYVSKPMSWWLNETAANTDESLSRDTKNATTANVTGLTTNTLNNTEINPKTLKGSGQKNETTSVLYLKGKQIEKALSESSVTLLFGKDKLPVRAEKWIALMPDAARCLALEDAILSVNAHAQYACLSLIQLPNKKLVARLIEQSHALIVGDITPLHATYELGGLDKPSLLTKRASEAQLNEFGLYAMKLARSQDKTVIFNAMRMPYTAKIAMEFADIGIATYDYAVTVSQENAVRENESKGGGVDEPITKVSGQSLKTLMKVLSGKIDAEGKSPVSWKQ